MAMNVQSADHDEVELNTTINTTPLVDVMLVLLIIFLITIPVIVKTVPLTLPNARNIATITKPENIVIAVDKDENIYWNNAPVRWANSGHGSTMRSDAPRHRALRFPRFISVATRMCASRRSAGSFLRPRRRAFPR